METTKQEKTKEITYRYDGHPIWTDGSLVEIDLRNWILYPAAEENLANWEDLSKVFEHPLDYMEIVNKYGKSPTGLILGVDPSETYYLVIIQNKKYVVAIAGCSLLELST